MQFTTILLLGVATAVGLLLGWLLRGERSERSNDIRLARQNAQLDSQRGVLERHQRQRDELQQVADDLRHRQHEAERRVATMRAALDEQLAVNRQLNKRLARAAKALENEIGERKRLSRQLRLLILRTQQSRARTAGVASPDEATAIEAAGVGAVDLDDLEQIRGIGPALARQLKANGIASITALSDLDEAAIDALDMRLAFPGRIRRDRWVEQARELVGRAGGPA